MRRLTSRLIALIQAQGALAHCFSCLAGDLAVDEPAVTIAAQALLGLRPKPCVISIASAPAAASGRRPWSPHEPPAIWESGWWI
jgi:hypothetical protein